ncbi:MAG TPA: helix-turn-helix domain-containing protein [Acidimicrobiales bacterium]|nr:helix-turn-helix domain-containing protein [Acidimicrobiales bacterium]
MPAPAKTATRQLLARPERRAAILEAAASAFVHEGFAATSMEDVAAAAGITRLILYRHFASKEALYEAVLDRVSSRLAEEYTGGITHGQLRGLGPRTLLTVAREDPDGFTLLWRHAARERQFADHATRARTHAVALARSVLHGRVADPTREEWAAELVVSYLVDAVLHWLEVGGDPAQDDAIVETVTRAARAMITVWSRPASSP